MSDCLFCAIAAGDVPATITKRTESVVMFADINPQAPIHVLAIPVVHYDNVEELVAADPQLAADLLAVAAGDAQERGLGEGYRVVFNTGKNGGQTVGHVHAHVLGGRQMGWPPG